MAVNRSRPVATERVRIEDVADTEFLIDEQTHKFRFREENELVVQAGGRRRTLDLDREIEYPFDTNVGPVLSDRPFCMYVRLQAGVHKLGRCGVRLASHDSHLRSVCRPLSFFLCNDSPRRRHYEAGARASSPHEPHFDGSRQSPSEAHVW